MISLKITSEKFFKLTRNPKKKEYENNYLFKFLFFFNYIFIEIFQGVCQRLGRVVSLVNCHSHSLSCCC